jgi:hypothetical protein
MMLLSVLSFPAHASGPFGENYTLTQSTTRIQETNSPGVTFVLNVTHALVGANYQFAWAVRDPSGTTHNVNTLVNTAPSTFTMSVNYPTSFGTSIFYVGKYSLTVSQTSPPPTTAAGTGEFQVGLTDALSYQRTLPVLITAQGYGASENVTISISSSSGSPPGFPTTRLASSAGVLSYSWMSIPASTPIGNYTVRLSGVTTKLVPDSQSFLITPANMTISQLSISQSSLQRSDSEDLSFTSYYPSGVKAKTGSATIRVTETDGVTYQYVTATYTSKLGMFQGSYQIPLSSEVGVWVASIDIDGFNDGYGNTGPSASVVRGFAVSNATLLISAYTNSGNYTTGDIIAIYASVVTPGGFNFTAGTVIASLYYSNREVRSPLQLLYDQSRGKWVGSYTINATDPSGVWIIEVNATDPYGNSGYGSTSTLVIIPPTQPPQQTPTFYYLLVVVALAAALAILGSWVVYRRGRISRKVLKVDLEAVHQEAEKIGNNEFFKRIQEQLKELRNDPRDGKTSA